MCYQPKDLSSIYFSKYFGHLMWRVNSWKNPWFLKRLRIGEERGDRGWDGSVQFSSVSQSCPTLYDPMDCSTPVLHVHHHLLEFTQTNVHWVSDAIQPSHPLLSTSPHTFNLSQHLGLFQMSQFFASDRQSFGVSALASVLLKNTQNWSPLEWTGWISLQSKGLSRVFSNTTVQKHQFFGSQLSS